MEKKDSFTMVNNDLIETDLLTIYEKMVYIVIRKHLNQEKKIAFPGMATISREARISKSQVIKAVHGLEEKGLITVQRQTTKYNEKKTNIYRFNDSTELWKAKTVEELKEVASKTAIQLTDEQIIDKALQVDKKKREELYNQLAKEFEKEKGLETVRQTQCQAKKQSDIESDTESIDNTISDSKKNQDLERYTVNQIKQIFDYDIMLHDYPNQRQNIDCVISVLHTAMNTNKATIRISKQDKPYMTVISKLMKLNKESIMYAIDKYSEQTDRIKHPSAYMLTILYSAPEQYHLDIQNRVAHDMAPEPQIVDMVPNDYYTAFPQREYDYAALEKEFLRRDKL